MAIDVIIVLSCVALTSLYAVVRGGIPERYCAAIIIAGIVFDRLFDLFFPPRGFDDPSFSRLAFDLVQFVGFLSIALYANRTWPLWVAASQILILSGSAAVLITQDGDKLAYWALTQLPLIVQLLALGTGTFAHQLRYRRIGAYNAWSPGSPKLLTYHG